MSWKERLQPLKPYALLLLLQLLIHASHLFKPASGNHVWRQCNSLALAKNYAEESMDIRYPRIDKRYGNNGICGPSFISYEYGLALLYKVFGFHETLFRFWSFLLCLAVVWGWFRFLETRVGEAWGLLGAASLFGFPEFYYHSINAVPDLLALAAGVWGVNLWAERRLGWAFLLLTLATATKLLFALFWVFAWVQAIRRKENGLTTTAMLLASVAAAALWYVWADRLNAVHGLWEFLNETRWALSGEQAVRLFLQNAIHDVPLTWVGPLFAIPLLLGFYRYARRGDAGFWLQILGALVLYLALQRQFEHHGYYILVFVPFASLLLLRSLESMRLGWAWALVGFSIIAAALQMERNFYGEQRRVSETLLNSEYRAQREALSAERSVWLVGPDPTGCVAFYYTGAKGYPWYRADESRELLGPFARAQSGVFQHPAQGIITDDAPAARRLAVDLGWQLDSLGSVGEWVWFGLEVR